MWTCPNCGERVDDVFDACWKCGTAQDGTLAADFQAEPGDSDDPRAEPDPSDEIAEDSVAAAHDPKKKRIVELCSAASAAEAYALRALLEEADIRCRVVGDSLGNAAGGLPLGEATSPRIWVWEEDAARAREIIDERLDQPCQDMSSLAEDVEPAALGAASQESDAPRASDAGFQGRSQALSLIGLACIVLGTVLAWHDWMLMHQYTGTAEAVVVQYQKCYSSDSRPTPELPIQRVPSTSSHWYEVQYGFVVNGKTYYSVDQRCQRFFRRVPIHYDPHDPANNIRGSLTSPWSVLAFALGIGGSLSFAGYYLARTGRQSGSV